MERIIIDNGNQLKEEEKVFLSGQVSQLIHEYDVLFPHEMLEQKPEKLADQLDRGLSVLLVSPDKKQVIFHATLYKSIDDDFAHQIGLSVLEFGSEIVHPERQGNGYGKEGMSLILKKGSEISSPNPTLFIATHKRDAALHLSEKFGFKTVNYEDVPYLTYLTCTCDCSERNGNICPFRRRTPEIVIGEDGNIDYSLFVSDVDLAKKFEERCREIHGLNALAPGEIITPERMARAREFFEG